MSTTSSRRAVTAGLAWSIPAVAATAAAPAFASSRTYPNCQNYNPTGLVGVKYHWGTLGTTGTTKQQLQLYMRMQMKGIATGSVESFTMTYTMNRRATNTASPGIPWIGDPASDYSPEKTTCTTTSCTSYQWSGHSYPSSSPVQVDSTATATSSSVTLTVKDFTSDAYRMTGSGDCGYTFDTGDFSTIDTTNAANNNYASTGTPLEVYFADQRRVASLTGKELTVTASYTINVRVGTQIVPISYSFPVNLAYGYNTGYFGPSW